jgi:uncharacterized repeat protein (TIGR03803 family)
MRLTSSVLLAAAMAVPTAGATTLTTLHGFQGGNDGAVPVGGAVYVNGSLYGVTSLGGMSNSSAGTVFKVDLGTGTESVIYSFAGGRDGSDPSAGLTYHLGALFGTTAEGGDTDCGCGTIFKIDIATGAEKVLYRFKVNDGGAPNGPMIYENGMLYGTLCGSCLSVGDGAVFQYDLKARKAAILHRFKGGRDGQDPMDSALLYNEGMLYGTTALGGDLKCYFLGCGTVFSINPATGQETILHPFKGGSDGSMPMAGLTLFNNKLFGTTAMGGHSPCMGGCGTTFNIDTTSKVETVIHVFDMAGGFGPRDNLVLDRGKDRSVHRGVAHGPTESGGDGLGSIFHIELRTGKVATDYIFEGGADGGLPSGLTEANGVFYGTTSFGGGGYGTVFELTP